MKCIGATCNVKMLLGGFFVVGVSSAAASHSLSSIISPGSVMFSNLQV